MKRGKPGASLNERNMIDLQQGKGGNVLMLINSWKKALSSKELTWKGRLPTQDSKKCVLEAEEKSTTTTIRKRYDRGAAFAVKKKLSCQKTEASIDSSQEESASETRP